MKRNAVLYVGPKGATVSYLRDGVILRSVPLVPGVYPVKRFLAARGRYEEVDFAGVAVVSTGARLEIENFGARAWESSANPHWRMSPSARFARDLKVGMLRMNAVQKSVKKGVEAMKRAKAAVSAQLAAPVAQIAGPGADAEVSAS